MAAAAGGPQGGQQPPGWVCVGGNRATVGDDHCRRVGGDDLLHVAGDAHRVLLGGPVDFRRADDLDAVGVDQVEVAGQVRRRGVQVVDGDGRVEVAADPQQLQPFPVILK